MSIRGKVSSWNIQRMLRRMFNLRTIYASQLSMGIAVTSSEKLRLLSWNFQEMSTECRTKSNDTVCALLVKMAKRIKMKNIKMLGKKIIKMFSMAMENITETRLAIKRLIILELLPNILQLHYIHFSTQG